jgi:hypothetical protein
MRTKRRTSAAILRELAELIIDDGGYPRFTVGHGRDFDRLAHEIHRRAGKRPAALQGSTDQ